MPKSNLRFLLAGLLLIISINAYATAPGQATDEAFAALLSMPGAEPQNGSWIFEPPPEFEPRTEANLIRWLTKKKKQGADFNAQRHFGTLLDHALRSHLERTALWLLDNGATSVLPAWGTGGSLSSQDALFAFAKSSGNKKVAEVLRQRGAKPYVNNPPQKTNQELEQLDAASAQPIFPNLLLACQDDACVTRLLQLKIRRPFEDAAFTFGVISGIVRSGNVQYNALNLLPATALQKVLDDPRLVRQLIQVFYTVEHHSGGADSHRAEIFEAFFNRSLNQRSQKLAQPLLNKISNGVLNQALDDDETLRQWMAWTSTNPNAEFQSYFQRVSDVTLQAHAIAAIKGMSTKGKIDFAKQYPNKEYNPVITANWLQLIARLPSKIDFTSVPPLLSKIEPELWPRLFAMGYPLRDLDADLGIWFTTSRPEQLNESWELLLRANPALQQQAIRLVLNSSLREPVLHANEYFYLGGNVERKNLEKVEFLLKRGVLTQPLTLHPTSMRNSEPSIIERLLALQIIVPLQVSVTPRFVPAQLDCQFTFNEVWYQALLNNRVIHSGESYEAVYVAGLQFISMPAQKNCVMLMSGSQRVDEYKSGPQDNFNGPTDEPRASCPDPTDRSEIWLETDGKIRTVASDAVPSGLSALRDNADGHLYYLQWPTGGMCSANTVSFVDWQLVNSQWMLKRLEEKHPAYQAFIQQCDSDAQETIKCLDIKTSINESSYGEEREKFLRENPYSSQSTIELISRYKTAEHQAYLTAIAELDKPKLQALQAQGIPPQWTTEALQALNKSTLPIADKRQRTAWIFRDHKQLAAALDYFAGGYDIPENLVDRLPREDWRPVLQALQGNTLQLNNIAEKARAKGLYDLACDVDHAMSLMCGETWSVEKP